MLEMLKRGIMASAEGDVQIDNQAVQCSDTRAFIWFKGSIITAFTPKTEVF
jgi:hypothetical protein